MELFNPTSHVLVDCQRSCFIVFLLKELRETASEKNEHIIGKSMKRGPSGRPDTNYFLAHHYNYQCYSDPLEDGDIHEFLAVV